MKKYIDAASTCFLISITDFYKSLYPDAPADIETKVSKVMVTSQFRDILNELQDKNNEILLSNLQVTIEKLIKCDAAEHEFTEVHKTTLNDEVTLTYRYISSDMVVLDLCH